MTTDKTDAELIALVKADMLKPGHMTCESCRLSVEEMIARIAELAQTAERLTHAKEGYALVYDAAIAMANDRAEKAEADAAASAKDGPIPDLSDDLELSETLCRWYESEKSARRRRGGSCWANPTQEIVEIIARKLRDAAFAQTEEPCK